MTTQDVPPFAANATNIFQNESQPNQQSHNTIPKQAFAANLFSQSNSASKAIPTPTQSNIPFNVNQTFTPSFTAQSNGVGTAQPNQSGPTQNINSNPNVQNIPNNTQTSFGTPYIIKSNSSAIKPKLRPFDGNIEKAIEWFNHLRKISNHYKWDEEEIVNQARLAMVEDAEYWYDSTFVPVRDLDLTPYMTDPTPTWSEFSEAFMKEYRPKGSKIMLMKKLQDLVKSKEETYVGFGRKVNRMVSEIDPRMPEEETLIYILNALKDDPNFMVIQVNKTLSSLNETLRMLDKGTNITKTIPKPTNVLPRRDPILRTFENRSDEKVSVVQNRPNLVRPNQIIGNKPSVIRQFPNVECMNCGEIGHFWRSCKKKPLDMDRVNRKWEEVKKQRTGEYWKTKENSAQIREFTSIEDMTEKEFVEYLQDCYGMTDTETAEESALGNGQNNMLIIDHKDLDRTDTHCRFLKGIGSPFVDVNINGFDVSGLVDTGATFSIVSQSFATKLNGIKIPWNYPPLKTVTNEICTPKLMLKDLKFTQFGKCVTLDVGIMDKTTNDLILGMDYINKMGLIIDTPTNTVLLSDEYHSKIKSFEDKIEEQSRIINKQIETIYNLSTNSIQNSKSQNNGAEESERSSYGCITEPEISVKEREKADVKLFLRVLEEQTPISREIPDDCELLQEYLIRRPMKRFTLQSHAATDFDNARYDFILRNKMSDITKKGKENLSSTKKGSVMQNIYTEETYPLEEKKKKKWYEPKPTINE